MIRICHTLWKSAIAPGPFVMLGATALAFLIALMLAAPWLAPHDPLVVQMADRLQPPSLTYPLGTDHMGRCVLSRLLLGMQSTLGVALLVMVTVALIGVPLGMLSGYIGGRLDSFLMRVLDGAGALPEFVVAIATAGFLGPSLGNLLVAIVWVKWIGYARTARGVVLSERKKEYIQAAQTAGSGTWTVLRRHLVRQVLSPVLVIGALDVGKIMLIISMMSYLGLGAQPPAPEWGAMLNEGRPYFQTEPQLMLYPGLAICLAAACFNLIGEGLRDRLDKRGGLR
ncbi:ABC transporter permease subunit [Paenibacillus sp. N4]|uniref:nickel transporter permease n=1 Tax=Paenibacillus vietnamensis TaxID=2590547 RepID=UPI001CD110FC|nr:nickel transporter permease [Paenibacillus vietnamensis]MCA0756636.1 ABC transporter permease subunit [Paenibacillus vietnamensis]